jgi:hypothetical protein
MTSAQSSFPQRLTRIDELTRGDHHYLEAEDRCYFLGEYTARMGFAHSATNNLIINFKKRLDRQGTPEWRHKGLKITAAASAMFNALRQNNLQTSTFVPVPPSKAQSDPMYDDRMEQLLQQLSGLVVRQSGIPLDIRLLVSQQQSTAAAHDGGPRPNPDQLAALYTVNHGKLAGVRPTVVICDDVLTTGSHYKAMCRVLRPHLPDATFVGLFLARRTPEATDFSEFFDII